MKPLQDKISNTSNEYLEDMSGAEAPPVDILSILRALLRRWKLIALVTLSVLIATYGVLKLMPVNYRSTVEILVYDPQGQIDATVQKPISPFVDALGNDAMSTEINVIRSKSVALRVADELGLDRDPEFQPDLAAAGWVKKSCGQIMNLAERLGFPDLSRAFSSSSRETIGQTDGKAERLDRAADELLRRLEVWQESYIINVAATSRDPWKAQRLASTIANDYLASQREARQEALNHVATWLKRRADDLQSQLLETESSIERLKAKSGLRDPKSDKLREQQLASLNTQLMTAREEVNDKRARLEQARHVIDAKGDIDSIAEFTASVALGDLRRKQRELNWSVAEAAE